MNMFEPFKYMNGSFLSKSKYMNGVGFQILAYKFIPKSPVDTLLHAPPEARVLNTNFVYHFCMRFFRLLTLKCISRFYVISAIVFRYRSL